jgi:peptide/nickel transport system permease protein
MKRFRKLRTWILAALLGVLCVPEIFVTVSYSEQHRELIGMGPSARFPLGTDDLGRDRFARLLYAARTSLLLASAAALLASVIAAIVGCAAGWIGGWTERIVISGVDLFLSLPWLFALLTVRALLPLDVAPAASVTITFLILGLLGWAAPARVVRARVRSTAASDFALQARAAGATPLQLLFRHVIPNMRPVLTAQFLVSIPIFVLTEANLGALGLGVTEPLPSLGSMLRELQDFSSGAARPYAIAPVVLLAVTVTILQIAVSRQEVDA